MAEPWTTEAILELTRSYQRASILVAAAELDVFTVLSERPRSAAELAAAVRGEPRATAILADALVAMGLLEKRDGIYHPAPGVANGLDSRQPDPVLSMLRHQANCLRSWSRLAWVVRNGRPAERIPSIAGADADRASFIEAMGVTSRRAAPRLVQALGPPRFQHLLDIGCGPGTWSIAFLRAVPEARATLFDLPEVLPITRKHIEAAGLGDRVELVGGSYVDPAPLPRGADLAWVSAIVHQNSRQGNRDLFAKVRDALVPQGRILIRDMVMDDTHTTPVAGALFAINMLVNTQEGGTFSLAELSEDLHEAGFGPPTLTRNERDMDSVVEAVRLD